MKESDVMEYLFVKMNMEYAKTIANWRYKGFMETIYMKPYFDNFNIEAGEMKGPGNCDGYVVLNQNEIIGLYEYYLKGDFIEVGLALNPKFVSRGLSKEFILKGIEFCIKEYNYTNYYIQLLVEIENKSAFYAYLKAGFKEIRREEDEIVMHYLL